MDKIIEVNNLSKTYGNTKVLDNVSFSVGQGIIFGLLGANGAGKSTTIECTLGIKKADSGEISVLGMDVKKDRKELFEQIGVQFQESNYQENIKVKELCELTASLYKKPADWNELLKQFGLEEKSNAYIKDLSGGQKQRLFIILALIPEPKVVFLDELTTGLDARARRNVWKQLLELKKKGITILLTSHFCDEVEVLCDRICILKKGQTVFYGTVKEAIENSPYDKFEDAYLWYTDEEDTDDEII